MIRGISPTAQDKFIKLPARQPEVKSTASIEAAPPPPSLSEEGPRSKSGCFDFWLIHTLSYGRIPPQTTAKSLVKKVCLKHSVTDDQLFSKDRRAFIAYPRQELMYRLRRDRGMTYHQIGKFMGLDHSTVIYGIRAYQARQFGIKVPRQPKNASRSTRRNQVLALVKNKPSTAHEISELLGLSIKTVRPRLSELKIDGKIRCVGTVPSRDRSNRGNEFFVWAAA